MTESRLLDRIEKLTSAVSYLAQINGTRLSRQDMCVRLDVCSKTLTQRVRDNKAPRPCNDGKWLLFEVLEWERRLT